MPLKMLVLALELQHELKLVSEAAKAQGTFS